MSTEAKHTKGLWELAVDNDYYSVSQKDGDIICDMAGGEKFRADADLIAAAPELLEACKSAFALSCGRSETKQKWTTRDQAIHEKLKQAIAKAEGR